MERKKKKNSPKQLLLPKTEASTVMESSDDDECHAMNIKFEDLLLDLRKQVLYRDNGKRFGMDDMEGPAGPDAKQGNKVLITKENSRTSKDSEAASCSYIEGASASSESQSNQTNTPQPVSGKPKIDYFPCNSPESKRRLHYLYQPLTEDEKLEWEKKNKLKKSKKSKPAN